MPVAWTGICVSVRGSELTDLQDSLLQRAVNLQRARVRLEVPLGGNQVDQFIGQVHV